MDYYILMDTVLQKVAREILASPNTPLRPVDRDVLNKLHSVTFSQDLTKANNTILELATGASNPLAFKNPREFDAYVKSWEAVLGLHSGGDMLTLAKWRSKLRRWCKELRVSYGITKNSNSAVVSFKLHGDNAQIVLNGWLEVEAYVLLLKKLRVYFLNVSK